VNSSKARTTGNATRIFDSNTQAKKYYRLPLHVSAA